MKEQIKREYYSEFRAKKTIYNRAPVKKKTLLFSVLRIRIQKDPY